jgi:hypothetical protein
MRNMNKFQRSLSEKSYLHFYTFNVMIEQPKARWEMVVPNLTCKLIANTQDDTLINNDQLQCLTNLNQFNKKC